MDKSTLEPIEKIMLTYVDQLFEAFKKKHYESTSINIPQARMMHYSKYSKLFDIKTRSKSDIEVWDYIPCWNNILVDRMLKFNLNRPAFIGNCKVYLTKSTGHLFRAVIVMEYEDEAKTIHRFNQFANQIYLRYIRQTQCPDIEQRTANACIHDLQALYCDSVAVLLFRDWTSDGDLFIYLSDPIFYRNMDPEFTRANARLILQFKFSDGMVHVTKYNQPQ